MNGKGGSLVLHLMFVDALFPIGEANESQVEFVMNNLKKYSAMSGQEVNKEKTCVMLSRSLRVNLM